jgi:tRNA 2-thiouridine synthesizing protein A
MHPTPGLDLSISPADGGPLAGDSLPRAEAVVDAIGLFCPIPIVRTAARVRALRPGAVLELRADDPVTRVDLPNWCRGQGHRFLGWTTDGKDLRLFLAVAGAAAGRAAAREE